MEETLELWDKLIEVAQGPTATGQGMGAGGTSDPQHIMFALLLAAVLGGFLALVYMWTYTGKRNNRTQFAYTLVLLCLGGSFVWLLVGNNVARAFGLAGALALIRYRTRMRDPKDTTLVFFAMITGMACGLHQYFIAIYGAFFIGLVLCIIYFVNRHNERADGKGAKHKHDGSTDAADENDGPDDLLDDDEDEDIL